MSGAVRKLLLASIATFAAVGLLAAAANADLASEVQQGQQLADSIKAGQTKCSDLSTDQFELIGEYAMNTYLPSTAAHEAMNQHMAAMMGQAGERRMHIVLGQRYAGCATGSESGWLGPMAGMMGRYGPGNGNAGGYSSGMMSGRGYGPMMGPGLHSNGGGVSALGAVMIGLAAAVVAGLLVALVLGLRGRRPSSVG